MAPCVVYGSWRGNGSSYVWQHRFCLRVTSLLGIRAYQILEARDVINFGCFSLFCFCFCVFSCLFSLFMFYLLLLRIRGCYVSSCLFFCVCVCVSYDYYSSLCTLNSLLSFFELYIFYLLYLRTQGRYVSSCFFIAFFLFCVFHDCLLLSTFFNCFYFPFFFIWEHEVAIFQVAIFECFSFIFCILWLLLFFTYFLLKKVFIFLFS